MKRIAMVVAALTLSGGLAVAQQTPEKTAEHHFNQANTAYNLGRYDDAAASFTKAYEAMPLPEFLYNIAQSYRLGSHCKQALHFYKRFKSLKEKDEKNPITPKKKAEVEKFIKETTDCAAKAESSAGTKPDTIDQPKGVQVTGNTTGTGTTPTPTGTGTTPTGTGTTPTGTGTTPTGTGTTPTGIGTTPTGTGTTPTGTNANTTTPTGTGTTTTTTTTGPTVAALDNPDGDPTKQTDTGVVATTETGAPKLISARMTGGVALLKSGDLNIPVQPSVGVVAGYPLPVGPMTLELGVGFAWTPLPYQSSIDGSQQRGRMIGVRAIIGAVYPVASQINLRGELGAGIVSLGGLTAGNPIADMRQAASFTLPSFRFGVAAEYVVGSNLALYLSPFGIAFSPGNDQMYGGGLREINVLVGFGYRQ